MWLVRKVLTLLGPEVSMQRMPEVSMQFLPVVSMWHMLVL